LTKAKSNKENPDNYNLMCESMQTAGPCAHYSRKMSNFCKFVGYCKSEKSLWNKKVWETLHYNLCWIGVSSNIIIVVNCRLLTLNWTWTTDNCVCGAHISLCGLNLSSQNLVRNVFYTSVIRNAFS